MTPVRHLFLYDMDEFNHEETLLILELERGGPGSGNFEHAGRPGEVGGSSSAGTASSERRRIESSRVFGNDYRNKDREYRKQLKINNVERLSKKLEGQGVKYQNLELGKARTEAVQSAWASNSTEGISAVFQYAVAQEFGLPVTELIEDKYKLAEESAPKTTSAEDFAGRRIDYELLGKAMYEDTQDYFREQGLSPTDTLVLYRGYRTDTDVRLDAGTSGGLEVNPLTSWSIDPRTAFSFGTDDTPNTNGYVMKTEVPIEKVFSTPFTGIGCLPEGEVVLLGNNLEYSLEAVRYTDGKWDVPSPELQQNPDIYPFGIAQLSPDK